MASGVYLVVTVATDGLYVRYVEDRPARANRLHVVNQLGRPIVASFAYRALATVGQGQGGPLRPVASNFGRWPGIDLPLALAD